MDQNDLPLEVTLHRIGPCPVCGKGQMLQGSAGWTCDYFRTINDKCTFTIFEKYNGYYLTEEDAVALITEGKTAMHEFVTKEGKPFTARLVRDGTHIHVQGDNRVLSVPCPICNSRVRETQKGYICDNYFNEGEEHCNVYIPKTICNREMTLNEVETVLEKGETEVLDGFSAQDRVFSAFLTMDKDGTCRLDSTVCLCPKCGGKLYSGTKAFTCGNFTDPEINCTFLIWRNVSGHIMTLNEVRTLCTHRQTPVLTFRSMAGTEYSGRLVINDQWKVIRI